MSTEVDTVQSMRALTICQPWAWAIMAGHKRFENRTWPVLHRGPLVIHAGKSRAWMERGCEFLAGQGIEVPEVLAFGAALGVVELENVCGVAQCGGDPYAFGPLCWVLSQPRWFAEPLVMPGAMGLFRMDVPLRSLRA